MRELYEPKWHVVVALSAFFGLAASPSQGPALNRVMREKLAHAQKILEAVVTSDWVSLETHSRELERLTEDPRWMVLKYPEYAQHSAAFVRTIQDLHRAAAQRDLEQTEGIRRRHTPVRRVPSIPGERTSCEVRVDARIT